MREKCETSAMKDGTVAQFVIGQSDKRGRKHAKRKEGKTGFGCLQRGHCCLFSMRPGKRVFKDKWVTIKMRKLSENKGTACAATIVRLGQKEK